jgi:hypothetical protein
MARHDDREYQAYLSEEQRRQPGCAARELCHTLRGQDTRLPPLARASLREGKGIPHDEILREFGLEPEQPTGIRQWTNVY